MPHCGMLSAKLTEGLRKNFCCFFAAPFVFWFGFAYSWPIFSLMAACAAARRAIGTRKGEQET